MNNEEKLKAVYTIAYEWLYPPPGTPLVGGESADNRFARILALIEAKPQPVNRHIWIDGGCLNNGCEDAVGYWSMAVQLLSGEYHYPVCKQVIPIDLPQTNNVAEYYALLQALRWIKDTKGDIFTIHTDSQLTVGQLTQNWKVKADTILDLWRECAQLLDDLGNVTLVKEPRERITAVLGH